MPPTHGIRPPAPVNLDSNPADSWILFRQKWQNYATITQLRKQPAEYQVALFLHTIGDAALQIYNEFTFDTDDDSRSVADIWRNSTVLLSEKLTNAMRGLCFTTETNNKANHSNNFRHLSGCSRNPVISVMRVETQHCVTE